MLWLADISFLLAGVSLVLTNGQEFETSGLASQNAPRHDLDHRQRFA